jgi:dTDP-4-amino-4,6-dideoxy-D-galactose acyltransferase
MQMKAKAPYTRLAWDSTHFGLSVARFDSHRLVESAVAEMRYWLEIDPMDCIYFLAEPEPQTMRLAARSGFQFVDSRVTLETPIAGPFDMKSPRIRTAATDDIAILRRIAGESHHNTRFYSDGNFPRQACDELYRLWIEKAIHEPNGTVLVALQEAQPVGYISCGVTNGQGQIGLLAVDSLCRSRSLGSELVREAIAWMGSNGATSIMVATQGLNVSSLRLYEKCGFSIASVELWYHLWAARFAACTNGGAHLA